MVEELVDRGEFRDTHQPDRRRPMARALAWHLELTRECGQPKALGHAWRLYQPSELWPTEAHSPIFDFRATADGAAWIDRIATDAKRMISAPRQDLLVGHHDWSGKHVRFDQAGITVVYDWDSLRLGSEAEVVGYAAMTYTTNFALADVKWVPTPEEVRAFIEEYAAARARALTNEERRRIAAHGTFLLAYTARCEHARPDADALAQDPRSFTYALRAHGTQYLTP